MRFWTRIARTYGGIARVPLKNRHVILVSDPKLLYELLVTKRGKFRKNIRYKAAVDTFGRGLLLDEGNAWKRQRLITQPTFKADYVNAMVPRMAPLVGRFIQTWEPLADGRTVIDVEPEFLRMSQLVAGHYLMGPDFDTIEERFYAAAIGIKDSWPLPPRNVLATYLPRSKRRDRRLEAAVEAIGQLIYAYVEKHRPSDFADCGVLETLVHSSRAQDDEFDDRALRDQLLTLFFAGHETSAASLCWIHYLLATHTGARDRVLAEVAEVLGEREPSAEDVDRLVYVERVVNESLRLHSPIHSISRVALEDETLGGFAIPAGTMLYVSLYATHRLPEYWPEPDVFDPDRFDEKQTAVRPRFAFIPFLGGHRNCIGGTMAMAELKLAVALIAQRYVLNVAPGHPVEERAGTVMHPRHGLKMTLTNVATQ
jgi:cytochrome P450